VRENLLFGAVLLGLSLILCDISAWKIIYFKRLNNTSILVVFTLFIGAVGGEVISSFGKFPFTYGSFCFINSPVTSDGWVSGYSELSISPSPENVRCVNIPRLYGGIEMETYCLGDNDLLNLKREPLNLPYMHKELVEISQIQCKETFNCNAIRLKIKTSSCFTPRNLGINLDGRRLGILIK
jgi:hypothetical protein